MKKSKINIAIVDDHELLRQGLSNLIGNFSLYVILFEAANGKELISKVQKGLVPDIVMLDINMPEMDGYDTALWLKKNYPDVKVLTLSMYDTESCIIRMLTNGAKGYIFKNSSGRDVKEALDSIAKQGHYFSEMVSGKLIHALNHLGEEGQTIASVIGLNERETEFIKLACCELSYNEIAAKMFVSPRTVENYRDAIYERFNIKSRVGLVMFAIKNGVINI